MLLVVLLAIIAILSSSLIYEIVQKHKTEKRSQQFFIALGVVLYQGLERGDVEAVKRRIGGDVASAALIYEQQYGHEVDTKFAPRLGEAMIIKEEMVKWRQATGK